MQKYRVFHVQRQGTVIPRGDFLCDTDNAALAKLLEFASPDLPTELWEGDRYIGQTPARIAEERR